MQDRIKEFKIFLKINIRERYYKIRIKKSEKWKTAWELRLGHYKQFIMPFGLINVSASF
jgi:hypothetical protein